MVYELHSSSSFNFKFLEKYNNSLNDSDYSIIYISNKKLNLFTEKISENKLQKFFNDKNIKLVNSINPLKKIIRSNKYKKYNKLFMSSGNFDDFNIYNFYNESK